MGISVTRRTYRAVAKSTKGVKSSVKPEETFFLDLALLLARVVVGGYRLIKSR